MRRFTELYIRNLQPQAKRYEVREPGGLGLWTYPSGRKSWVFTYRFLGKKYRIILGEYPAKSLKRARTELNDQRKLLADGANPKDARDAERVAAIRAREAEEQELSVKRLAELYLGLWAKPRKRTWRKDQLMLEKDVIPRWGRRKVKTITLRDVVALLDDIQARGAPIQANRMLALLKKMFNFSIGRGYMTTNPCKGITMPAQETPGQRVLTTDEIKTFWTRLETAGMEDDLKRILKLVLILGQRPGEICGAQWEQISGDLWTIPGERHKSKRAHAVPLPTLALSILGTRRLVETQVRPCKDANSPRGDSLRPHPMTCWGGQRAFEPPLCA